MCFSGTCSYGNSQTSLTLAEKVLQTNVLCKGGVSIPAEISLSISLAPNLRGRELSLRGRQFDAIDCATCESVGSGELRGERFL